MRSREECLEKFQDFFADIGKPKLIVSDGAKEFVSSDFKSFCRKESIRCETSASYTPEKNGKIEGTPGTVIGMRRCMLDQSGLSKPYWSFALSYAFYVENDCFHSGERMTPYEKIYFVKPDVSFLSTFGCKVFAFVEKPYRKKMDKTANKGVFLGFSRDSKTYIFGIPEMGKLKVIKTRNVKFNEEVMFFFASNQEMIKLFSDVIDEGKHNQASGTKGVHNNGQPSNPCLDTPNEPSMSWQPRNSRKSQTGSFQLQYRNR